MCTATLETAGHRESAEPKSQRRDEKEREKRERESESQDGQADKTRDCDGRKVYLSDKLFKGARTITLSLSLRE